MAIFGGRRMFRPASGAGAGRGDDAHGAGALPRIPGAPRPPAPPIKIGSGASTPNPLPNTRAARKANSPKAKARALKAVNKNPLTPSNDSFASKNGFEESDAARSYVIASGAEKRLAADKYPSEPPKPATYTFAGKEFPADQRTMKQRDTDAVGSYKETGESHNDEWLKEKGTQAIQKKYG